METSTPKRRSTLWPGLLVLVGGCGLLIHSAYGLMVLPLVGFDSIGDWAFVAAFTLGFPIFLIGIASLQVAIWLLWGFFVARWVYLCVVAGPKWSTPFDWWQGDLLFASIALVSVGYLLLSRRAQAGKVVCLRNLLED